jgi:hypothetical protein
MKVKPKELDIELGQYKFKGKCRGKNTAMTGADIEFTINGIPYTEIIGSCSKADIHIGNSESIVTIDLEICPGKCHKKVNKNG